MIPPMECDYCTEFEEPREEWISWYFSWSEKVNTQEIHTARDGFDAGAYWQKKKSDKLLVSVFLLTAGVTLAFASVIVALVTYWSS